MNLLALESSHHIDLAARWLSLEENYQWLDFGSGVQKLTPVTLRVMAQREIHAIRLFTADNAVPIGIVALSNIDQRFRTSSTWFVLGEKEYAHQGYTTRAVSMMLRLGFCCYGLHAVTAWTVETNRCAMNLLRRLNFRFMGRQRQCHRIGHRMLDRVLFDLLDTEYRSA